MPYFEMGEMGLLNQPGFTKLAGLAGQEHWGSSFLHRPDTEIKDASSQAWLSMWTQRIRTGVLRLTHHLRYVLF